MKLINAEWIVQSLTAKQARTDITRGLVSSDICLHCYWIGYCSSLPWTLTFAQFPSSLILHLCSPLLITSL
jgi:hypothetical protein